MNHSLLSGVLPDVLVRVVTGQSHGCLARLRFELARAVTGFLDLLGKTGLRRLLGLGMSLDQMCIRDSSCTAHDTTRPCEVT